MLLGVDLGQMVLNHISLPVLDGAVTFDLLFFEINIFDVHASVLREISELDLMEFFSKQLLGRLLFTDLSQALHGGLAAHRCL